MKQGIAQRLLAGRLLARRRSLQRAAQRQRDAQRVTTTADRRRARGRRVQAARRWPGYLLILIVAAAALLFLPVPCCPQRPAGSFSGAAILIGFWGVEATTVTLFGAVMVFVFQIFATRGGESGTLLDFAYDVYLLDILILAVAGILIVPVVLAGYGSGAPGGWAVLFAIVLLAVPIALLPNAFQRALAAVEPTAIEARRSRRIQDAVRDHVDQVALEDAADEVLADVCERFGVDRGPTLAPASVSMEVIPARVSGVIADIDLHALEVLASEVTTYAAGQRVRLIVRMGLNVVSGDSLLVYPTPLENHTREIARRIVRVDA